MNLICDESVERPVVERLRVDGHSVVYVAELSPGIADEDVLSRAKALRAPLVTCDKDFGELVYRQGRASHGVVLARLTTSCTGFLKAGTVARVRQRGVRSRLPGRDPASSR